MVNPRHQTPQGQSMMFTQPYGQVIIRVLCWIARCLSLDVTGGAMPFGCSIMTLSKYIVVAFLSKTLNHYIVTEIYSSIIPGFYQSIRYGKSSNPFAEFTAFWIQRNRLTHVENNIRSSMGKIQHKLCNLWVPQCLIPWLLLFYTFYQCLF